MTNTPLIVTSLSTEAQSPDKPTTVIYREPKTPPVDSSISRNDNLPPSDPNKFPMEVSISQLPNLNIARNSITVTHNEDDPAMTEIPDDPGFANDPDP